MFHAHSLLWLIGFNQGRKVKAPGCGREVNYRSKSQPLGGIHFNRESRQTEGHRLESEVADIRGVTLSVF